MAANMFQVSSGSLRSKKEELNSLRGQFDAKVGELESSKRKFDSTWTGTAKENFDAAFTEDIGVMQGFSALIDSYVKNLERIIASYENAEQQNIAKASTRDVK